MRCLSYLNLACLAGTLNILFSFGANAGFIPLALTPASFNQDAIVEKTGPSPLVPFTTASMENGTNNTGLGFYEKGYNTDYPGTGLPAAGTTFTSEATGDRTYQLAPEYKTNNALMIDAAHTSGTLTLITPGAFAELSLLVAAGNGSGTIQYTVHYQNAATQTGSITCPDWYLGLGAACVAHGAIDVTAFVFNGVNSSQPGLFSRDITLSITNSPVVAIDFTYLSGASHNAVFALSAAAAPDAPFVPISLRGFNVDLIVEASATKRTSFSTATTATLEHGTLNTGKTFYEQGYYSPAALSGLPGPGSIIIHASAPDHQYAMPPSYSINNAVLVDADSPSVEITLTTPSPFAALSLLCAAGHGPTTNLCIVRHSNGSVETNVLIIPDWMSGGAPAVTADGRINTDNRVVDGLNSGSPRLFGCDFTLANTASPVTNLAISFVGGPSDAHGFIFAVSGSSSGSLPSQARLSITRNPNGTLTLATTQPRQLQSTPMLQGPGTSWQSLGAITTTTNLSPATSEPRFYRVLSQ